MRAISDSLSANPIPGHNNVCIVIGSQDSRGKRSALLSFQQVCNQRTWFQAATHSCFACSFYLKLEYMSVA